MLEDASNSELLASWKAGHELAANALVRRYMSRLSALARARLSRKLARRVEPEDIVMSAWRSFFVAAERSQISVPDDDDLWPLLVTVTLRKLSRQAERHTAAKRSVESEGVVPPSWESVITRDPSPEEAAFVSDEVESLMSALSEMDRDILARRLQGEEQAAISESVGCSERTVRRALSRAREEFVNQFSKDAELLEGIVRSPQSAAVSGQGVKSPGRNRQQLQKATIDYGDILIGQFLGDGAFGRVYRSQFQGQPAAVKFLRKRFWKRTTAGEQIIREVEIVSRLSHHGIVRNFGWGQTAAGAVFSVMELVDGSHLEDWRRSAVIAPDEILDCGIQICESLVAAHQSGVIHADLTPRNVLRRNDGQFVLTDFGFSRIAGDSLRFEVAGTPGFMAPEQLCDAFGRVSERTDVYGLGGLLYFLLEDRPPVVADSLADVLALTLSSRACPVITKPDASVLVLGELVRKCLEKEPRDRPDSVVTVLAELVHLRGKC